MTSTDAVHKLPLRITVVGGGIIGLSAAWALTRRGHEVTLVEQGKIPNTANCSYGRRRLIRHAYGGEVGYSRMVDGACEAWEKLSQDLGQILHTPIGTLILATTDAEEWLHDTIQTLETEGHTPRWLSKGDLRREFPIIDPGQVQVAFHLDTGGMLEAELAIREMVVWLTRAGARILTQTKATTLEPDTATVVLEDGSRVEGDGLIVAAGAWVSNLLPGMARRVTPSRQCYLHLEAPEGLRADWQKAPMILNMDPDRAFFIAPPFGSAEEIKMVEHRLSLSGHPDDDRTITPEEAKSVFELCAPYLVAPEDYAVKAAHAAYYTVESRKRLIVEPLAPRAWVMTGDSGHGFKFGPLLGEMIADTLDETISPQEIVAWAAGQADHP